MSFQNDKSGISMYNLKEFSTDVHFKRIVNNKEQFLIVGGTVFISSTGLNLYVQY